MSEAVIQSEILRAIGSQPDCRLFRNQVGTGFVGSPKFSDTGGVFIKPFRRVSMGLHVGSADLIGWRSYVIKPEDVGKTVAIFLSVEIKSPKARTTPEQINWRDQVNASGGCGVILRDQSEIHLVTLWKPRTP